MDKVVCTVYDRPVMSMIGAQHSLLAMQSFIMTSNPSDVKVLNTKSHKGTSEHCLYTLLCPLTIDRFSAILGPPLKDCSSTICPAAPPLLCDSLSSPAIASPGDAVYPEGNM